MQTEPNSADLGVDWTVETAIANLQQTTDHSLRYYAAWWLGHFQVNLPDAIAALIAALFDESHRSPDGGFPLGRNAARALGKLTDERIVPALRERLNCEDYYVREAVIQSLERQGDPQVIPDLIAFLDGGLEAAVQMPGKSHLVQPYEAVLEALGTLGATEAIALIEPFLEHPTPKVQFAAARSLYQLTQAVQYGEYLVAGLQQPKLALRRSVLMDLGASGYLPGAEAIAKTFAENSLKLIALKGLLAASLPALATPEDLTDRSLEIMDLMDALL